MTHRTAARYFKLLGDVISWLALFGLLAWIYLLILEEAAR